MKLHLCAFLVALDRLKETILEFRKFARLVGVHETASAALKGLRTEFRVLHLLRKPRLLRLENVSKELVQFDAIGDGKFTSLELGYELIAIGHFFRTPTTGATFRNVRSTLLDATDSTLSGSSLTLATTPTGSIRESRRSLPGFIDLTEGHGEQNQTFRLPAAVRAVREWGAIAGENQASLK